MSTTGNSRRWWQYLIPSYGNWGGPGYSAGQWNNDPAQTDWKVDGIDDMDRLFKAHDWVYQHDGDLDAADRLLVARLLALRVTGIRARLYRIGAMVVFTVWPYIRSFLRGEYMRYLFWMVVFVVAAGCGMALDVPPLTAAELSPEAHPIWLFLAGNGFWGTLVMGVVGFAYRLARPYLLAWLEERRLAKLYLAGETCVAGINKVYTEGMKAANADGKLTEDEKRFVFEQCKGELVAFMQSQGVDIIKEYGNAFVDFLIELIVARMKNPLLKAVAAPLPDSPPLPDSVSSGAMPA